MSLACLVLHMHAADCVLGSGWFTEVVTWFGSSSAFSYGSSCRRGFKSLCCCINNCIIQVKTEVCFLTASF